MRTLLTRGLAALTLATSSLAATTPATAHDWHEGYEHRNWERHGDNTGAAIAGGILGLAVGAAIAGGNHRGGYRREYYERPVYAESYGDDGYYDEPRVCIGHRTVWDPYWGRYVVRSFRYGC